MLVKFQNCSSESKTKVYTLYLKLKFISITILFNRSRKENLQLSSEYNKLQESYKELEALKDRLQDKESTWMSNLTDSQKETESTLQEVRLGDSDSLYYNRQVQGSDCCHGDSMLASSWFPVYSSFMHF